MSFKTHLTEGSRGGHIYGPPSSPPGHGSVPCGQFRYRYYSDGSGPLVEFLKPGAKFAGVNERLDEQGRRKIPPRDQKSIIHTKSATTLCFTRWGLWARIHGDMGRIHLPQPWAAGVLPLFPSVRLWALANTRNPDVLRFNMPESVGEQVELAKAYLRVVAHGWAGGFVSGPRNCRDLVKLLVGVGFDKLHRNRKVWRAVRDTLIDEGYIQRLLKRNRLGCDTPGYNFHLDMPFGKECSFSSQWELFKPYLRVPDEGLDFTPSFGMSFTKEPVLPLGGFAHRKEKTPTMAGGQAPWSDVLAVHRSARNHFSWD